MSTVFAMRRIRLWDFGGAAGHGEGRRAVAWFALLLALPLGVFGIFAALLINADYAVTRTHEFAIANQEVGRLDLLMRHAVETRADTAIGDARAALHDQDPTGALRLASYTDEARFILVHRDGQQIFPPVSGATFAEQEALRRFAGAMAAARSEMATKSALKATAFWTADGLGLSFIRCRKDVEGYGICVVFDESALDPVLEVALNSAASKLVGWALSLRDPAGRAIWNHGTATTSTSIVSALGGAMGGWHVEAAPPPVTHWGFLPLTAILVPLLGSWAFVVLHMYRSQRTQLAESHFRSEMTAKLSHDLRTPIANLRLYADLAARRADDEQAVRRYCEVLQAEVERLALLADNTVVYGRGAEPRPLRLETAIPDEVLDAVVARYETLFAAAGSSIEVIRHAPNPCRFDRMGFERILINLLDNACKYAPGQIKVATHQDGHRLSLSVRDFGQGFDEAFKAKLDAPHKPRKDGFGLGLSVVRDLAEANGGKITVENLNPGARVTVTLKTGAADHAAEAKCPS